MVLAAVILGFQILPYIPLKLGLRAFGAAPGDMISAYGPGFHHYCIDGYGANNALIDGDLYQYVLPSQTLSEDERAVIFWAMLSLQYSFGTSPEVNAAVARINEGAAADGLPGIGRPVTEADLKNIIHVKAVRSSYPWLDAVLAEESRYLAYAGLLGKEEGSGADPGQSGEQTYRIPAVLQGHDSPESALQISKARGVLSFDENGEDRDFIASVPLRYSLTGAEGSYGAEIPGGWTCQKTEISIIFRNPDPNPPGLFVMFDPSGTPYQRSGSFSSAEEVYESCLQIWVCIQCAGTHRQKYVGTAPLSAHQRLAFVELDVLPMANYYAAVGGSGTSTETGTAFLVYRHEENFVSAYNVQLGKYDHETGNALEHAVFNLYERFDDRKRINRERDGAAEIYEGGEPYRSYHRDNPAVWEDFRFVTSVFTDEHGLAEKTINHGYHYDKTFCDGHPAPVFTQVPQERYDPETGDLENGSEIRQAQSENMLLADTWQSCFNACEDYSRGDFSGVHFDWKMVAVDEGVISAAAGSGGSPGERPQAGQIRSASGDEAFSASGCRADAQATYDNFISLKYSYALKEETARTGYSSHGLHRDDLPIEVITTDASQNGANTVFAGEYSDGISVAYDLAMKPAKEILEARAKPVQNQILEPESRPEQKPESFLQKLVRLFVPLEEDEEMDSDETELVYDLPAATGSNAGYERATASDADCEIEGGADCETASASNQAYEFATASNVTAKLVFTGEKAGQETVWESGGNLMGTAAAADIRNESASRVFTNAYYAALGSSSQGDAVKTGADDQYSFCHREDGNPSAWRIFDHRTEGEIHMNKRDLDLKAGADASHGEYDSRGDTQGDGVLEGAVYGLFAAEDVVHPDGKTGVVYRKNNLVAVASTDKEGDASFVAITEAPGQHYDYEAGRITEVGDDWAEQAPANLYDNNAAVNGNCWIGRPLLLGSYYIKELTRSEGYELSIGNREREETNLGQDCDAGGSANRDGYVSIVRDLFAEEQISDNAAGDYNDPDYNELFFTVESRGTAYFDLMFSNLPPKTKLYRLDRAVQLQQAEQGTGNYEMVGVTDGFGNPVYVTAEHDRQYPRYNPDGNFMTRQVPVSAVVSRAAAVSRIPLDEQKTQESLLEAGDGMNEDAVKEKLMAVFEEEDLLFLKSRLERALRANRKYTPRSEDTDGPLYSDQNIGVYDDCAPIQVLEIGKTSEAGDPVTCGDLLATILDFYHTNDFYDFGGLEGVEEYPGHYRVSVYAGRYGNPADFFVADASGGGWFYHRVEAEQGTEPADAKRCVYAVYGAEERQGLFGIYEDFSLTEIGDTVFASATLVTDAVCSGDGILRTKTIPENVYYRTGEITCDAFGNPIQKVVRREQMTEVTQETEVGTWTELLMEQTENGTVARVETSYTDAFGAVQGGEGLRTFSLKLALPERMVTLDREDLALMEHVSGWSAGEAMGAAAYYLLVCGARAKACLDRVDPLSGGGSYIQPVVLAYPGQYAVWQDGEERPGSNTRAQPVEVQERAIRQKIRIAKTTDRTAVDGFRFKAYLKSNLRRLYRDEEGRIVWLNRKGQEIDVLEENWRFPEKVRRIDTRVSHAADPLYRDSLNAVFANTSLYGYGDGQIAGAPSPGYTAVLETLEIGKEADAHGIFAEGSYNYEKFFDALAAANQDKWDEAAPTYTAWRPLGNAVNQSQESQANTRVSDNVRQFAIDWYLNAEIEKLEAEGVTEQPAAYGDRIYDLALYQAIEKAENYLKPFFTYDLDEIYAIAWDGEPGGGPDRDETTLAADLPAGTSHFYGLSAYLPYGTYVIAEQQPSVSKSGDFKNRHYQIDRPREIAVPTVYENYHDAQMLPGTEHSDYRYEADMPIEEMERRYHIRFGEEDHVIQAHNHSGDFQVYKYGLAVRRIANGVPDVPDGGDYFALTQSEFRPEKNYYNEDDRMKPDGNSYYLTGGQSGRQDVSRYYRYSSVSEAAGIFGEDGASDGGEGRVKTMQGSLTACDGAYAPMLVPYTLTDSPDGVQNQKEMDFMGYAYGQFRNSLYQVKLRLEKLDSETHENILHDGAVFQIYEAKRDERSDGSGHALFYEEDTLIIGTKEFLESMGASDIRPVKRQWNLKDFLIEKLTGKGADEEGAGTRCTGVVPAGTPICEEVGRVELNGVVMGQQARFRAFSTVRTDQMEQLSGEEDYGSQTVGYLELPQPLDAGAYVICETAAPAGYVRSKPVAVEIYSDQTTYYQEGRRDARVLAACYEYISEDPGSLNPTEGGGLNTARIHVENTPIKLEVKKLKESSIHGANTTSDKTVTYRVSGRVDGSLTEIGNHPDYVYAYDNGDYLGYAWKKGTLEQLAARKAAGEQVEIVYEGGVFAGYGYVTRTLDTADDVNPYVAGAVMSLYEALELSPSGDTEDHAYKGLVIERSESSRVTRMYVKQGFAGTRIQFGPAQAEESEPDLSTEPGCDAGTGIWSAISIERPDTDILYYDLSGLSVTSEQNVDGRRVVYGYDRNQNRIPIIQVQSDQQNYEKTDREPSVFAWKDGKVYLEFVGGDLTKLRYSAMDKILMVDKDTLVYHLDRDGCRDSLVDPHTGMAYVTEQTEAGKERILVWPVKLHRDSRGNVIEQQKITTARPATVLENQDSRQQESGYITGSWESERGEKSHRESTVIRNSMGQNLCGEALVDDNNGSFEKYMNPVYDRYGLIRYYRSSGGIYEKSTALYREDGTFVRRQDSDNLEAYNQAAWQMDGALRHRLGEGYVLENSWTTSDASPNDPFQNGETDGQADLLKRVPAGHYIMEEVKAPSGYVKGMSVGVTVQEKAEVQQTAMIDKTIKVEISKVNTPSFGAYPLVPGAVLALFEAEHAEEGASPFVYRSTEHMAGAPRELTARWISGENPIYLEGIPAGKYILKELITPAGFVTAEPMELEILETAEVQTFVLENDHTRVEVEKYTADGTGSQLVNGAGFALFEAEKDEAGDVIWDQGKPQFDAEKKIVSWLSSDGACYRNFIPAFEEMYREFGTSPGTVVAWDADGVLCRAEYVSCESIDASISGGRSSIWPTTAVMVFRTEEGKEIRIHIYGQKDTARGRDFTFDYQFEYQRLPEVNDYACTYLTLEGRQRFDYLPAGGKYVLVEESVPDGYMAADNVLVEVASTKEVQLYRVENKEGILMISKTAEDCRGEQPGAHLGLYRADENGELTQSEAYLITDWITGQDGVCTPKDLAAGLFPEEYQVGDLLPHRIRRMEDGVYWLVEIKSPGYYTRFEPVRIVYRQEEGIRIVRVSNRPVAGCLELKKTDEMGTLLPGAVFELAAYREGEPEIPVFVRSIYMTEGTVSLTELPVGEIQDDGTIIPYHYQLRETAAPEGYEAETELISWQFAPDKDSVSYLLGEQAVQEVHAVNRKIPEELDEPDKPEEPEEPEKPEEPEGPEKPEEPDEPGKPRRPDNPGGPDVPKPGNEIRIGLVTASYQPGTIQSAGWLDLRKDGRFRLPLPGTGDPRADRFWYCLVMLSAGIALFMIALEKRRNKENSS